MAPTLEPQQQISHYRVTAPLGAGGMGEVYLARDETLHKVPHEEPGFRISGRGESVPPRLDS